jgi:hypothetical protein
MVANGIEPAASIFRVKSEGNMLLQNVVTSLPNYAMPRLRSLRKF